MYEAIKGWLLWAVRVPPEPLDPMGDVRMLRVFRAAPGYFNYTRLGWIISQVVFFAIAIFMVVLLLVASSKGGSIAVLAILGALLASIFFMAQAVVTYLMLRLNYEMRWYKVTDRSLRIREGIMNVHEMTLTFANIQNITVEQGPLERLFGIANVKVETAGGGGSVARGPHGEQLGPNLHLGTFRGVDNAEEIRDLMLERLRKLKDAGLGDLDEKHLAEGAAAALAAPAGSNHQEMIGLLAMLRDEARAMRMAAEGKGGARK